MKLRNLILAVIATFAIAGSVSASAWATSSDQPASQPAARTTQSDSETEQQSSLPASTFSSETSSDDSGLFWFGKNVLYAGNNVTANGVSRGLLFAAGNNLQLNSQSEYAFAAGNTIVFRATTDKDLFLAGNSITIPESALIGRDVFATGNTFLLEADIHGDVSVGAARATFKDVTIDGNLNLSVGYVDFQGQVQINGALTYNDDATVSGLTNVKYGKLETYTPTSHNTTAGEVWLTKMIHVVGLFFTLVIIFLVFPGAKQGIAREADTQRFGVDLMYGLGFVIIVPLVTLIFLLSFFAVSTSIFLIIVYCLVFYLATAFAGAWLGHVLVEKLCHCTLPMLVEALVGILLITCAGMIPGLNFLVSALTLVLGAGVIIACLRGDSGKKSHSDDKHVYYAAETPAKSATKTKPTAKTKTSRTKK